MKVLSLKILISCPLSLQVKKRRRKPIINCLFSFNYWIANSSQLSTQFASIRCGQIKSCLVDYGFTFFFLITFNHRKVRSGDNIKNTEEKNDLGV